MSKCEYDSINYRYVMKLTINLRMNSFDEKKTKQNYINMRVKILHCLDGDTSMV